MFAHVGLELAPAERAAMAARLSQPSYYELGFTAAEEAIIADETGARRRRSGLSLTASAADPSERLRCCR